MGVLEDLSEGDGWVGVASGVALDEVDLKVEDDLGPPFAVDSLIAFTSAAAALSFTSSCQYNRRGGT